MAIDTPNVYLRLTNIRETWPMCIVYILKQTLHIFVVPLKRKHKGRNDDFVPEAWSRTTCQCSLCLLQRESSNVKMIFFLKLEVEHANAFYVYCKEKAQISN